MYLYIMPVCRLSTYLWRMWKIIPSTEGGWDNFETRLAPALQYMQQQFLEL